MPIGTDIEVIGDNEKYGDYDLAVAYVVKTANASMRYTVPIVFVCLLLAIFIICYVTGHSIETRAAFIANLPVKTSGRKSLVHRCDFRYGMLTWQNR